MKRKGMASTEERIVKIESVLFTTNGNKGLAQKYDESQKAWWNWHDHERKKTCYFLNHKVEDMETKKWTLQKIMVLTKDIGVIIAIITLILKICKVF